MSSSPSALRTSSTLLAARGITCPAGHHAAIERPTAQAELGAGGKLIRLAAAPIAPMHP
ncbi:hypothetical protein EVJ58_g10009 [Rhodofomes roseus]|uniref:Uncharacterized protein n=1 Tax=Rhodofomes roseus TaxID=34475 RepID=A0A4Y9XQU5_9APHY|nr:hypothetical protein EVJ58_g10009 [Rhodofomes roseus]